MEPIIKSGVRILRPSEFKLLVDNGIKKFEHKIQFKALLYSGTRYAECKRLHDNPLWFDGTFIHIPSGKEYARQKERWVRLNPQGREVIATYLQSKKNLPATPTWYLDLKRWCNNAGLSSAGISPKTTRKTWESWLTFYYGTRIEIPQSQGHTGVTAFQYYLNMPFTDEDRNLMKQFVEGWI